jgi:glutamate racemase
VREAGVDTLILGCTHYPLLKQEIAAFMGAGVKLVDSADALATAAQARLAALGLLRDETAGRPGELSFLLSDIPWKFQEIGARFLGKPIVNMQTVELDEMEEAGHAIG